MERTDVGSVRQAASTDMLQSNGLYGPYLNAPVWPWVTAGWTISALFVVALVLAWWGF